MNTENCTHINVASNKLTGPSETKLINKRMSITKFKKTLNALYSKARIPSKMAFIIDEHQYILILGFISNFFAGFVFAQFLQIPYIEFFSNSMPDSNSLATVALFLLLYRLGRFITSLFDSYLPQYLKQNGFKCGMFFIGISILLIFLSSKGSMYLIFSSALLAGFGSTISNLNLRELLTENNDLNRKRNFNILSNIGWSVGVGFSGLILIPTKFTYESHIAISLLIVPLLIQFKNTKNSQSIVEKQNKQPTENPNLSALFQSNKDLLLSFAMMALFSGLITNQINSSIMNQITNTLNVSEKFRSLVLILPVIGSLFSLIPFFKKTFSKIDSFMGIGILVLTYFLILLILSSTSNLFIFCLFLGSVGIISNEILTALYQAVATKQIPALRRPTHALIETVTVVGSFLIWLINKFLTVNYIFNSAVIVIIPCCFLFFMNNLNLFRKDDIKYVNNK